MPWMLAAIVALEGAPVLGVGDGVGDGDGLGDGVGDESGGTGAEGTAALATLAVDLPPQPANIRKQHRHIKDNRRMQVFLDCTN
jgi:hypothetical protein